MTHAQLSLISLSLTLLQGGLSRQEAVSMVPVFFLDVLPGHRVLDLCAAPGSKTAQIIECLSAPTDDPSKSPLGTSAVIANDIDERRYDRFFPVLEGIFG